MGTAIGGYLTRTGAKTFYWDLTTDVSLGSPTPMVALLADTAVPTATTVWTTAAWSTAEVINSDGTHTRRLKMLVAGPNGPTLGSPLVAPAVGEYDTWVRVDTATERIEVRAQMLAVQ
jgi:hypothetical protein